MKPAFPGCGSRIQHVEISLNTSRLTATQVWLIPRLDEPSVLAADDIAVNDQDFTGAIFELKFNISLENIFVWRILGHVYSLAHCVWKRDGKLRAE